MEEALGGHPGRPPFHKFFEWDQIPTLLHPQLLYTVSDMRVGILY